MADSMKTRLAVYTLLAFVLIAGEALAQSSPPGPSGQAGAPSAGGMPGGGMMGGHMHGAGMPMLEMCRQMMMGVGGGGMMGGTMGMMGGGDPATMMQMRGEMLKAMGDIMLKYGKSMEGAQK
jgi:hypothetical protein